MTTPGWYLRRLSRMGPLEIAGRVAAETRKRRWRRGGHGQVNAMPGRRFSAGLDTGAVAAVQADARARLLATAERLLDGYGEFFGVSRTDLLAPDWAYDPRTGTTAPNDAYAFDIAYRDEKVVGDIKQLWELSRHQHLTVLAAAYAVSGDDRYAQRVADHLKSWWAANPPLRGVHWVSGIELGIRLLSWVWVRRLLDGWPGAKGLFEDNPEALHQVWWHQRWLVALPSRGSSANNHAVAEQAGLLASACAFDWFAESTRWGQRAMAALDERLRRNTFGSGLNAELATEYHGLVLELGLAGVLEADAAGLEVPDSSWLVLNRMTDALAAVVDTGLRPPRQGDADDGYGLLLDGAGTQRWAALLRTGGALFGRLDWWPETPGGDLLTPLLTSLARAPRAAVRRPARRRWHFADAGLTLLRTSDHEPGTGGEIWCRCDGGPHGFGSIAAHAHADALSIEVRHDGVDVLADPGTYCYHREPAWRAYFRSTLAHNTMELAGRDQSVSGGPFLWTRHARTRVIAAGPLAWSAEHDGYAHGRDAAIHRRSVELDPRRRELKVVDEVRGAVPRPCRLAYHLGPTVTATVAGNTARLRWSVEGHGRAAVLLLPPELTWTAHRGETQPPLGWYSPGFGRRQPCQTLLGTGLAGESALTTVLRLPS
ncbi:Heparinase II/III-like protein [Saccharomonospora marina XMU15]|uniref:Heparinase II/III-like protein n=1 Tax=Saccharomonospora marina XMU15 TaxID=882083 RepID=H5X592_9PSEU|nr:alginate lyase family protein [Saccharomonospora marina]EHR48903.1 Heparinase II/III-like protein [Saccharomonospora marina XMU15]